MALAECLHVVIKFWGCSSMVTGGGYGCPACGCVGCWTMWAITWCPRPCDRCENRWRASGTGFNDRLWFHKDVFCGMPCAGMTHWILAGCAFAGTTVLIHPWLGFSWQGVACLTLFNGWLLLAALSQWRCMTTDPGTVPKEAIPPPGELEANRDRGIKTRRCPRSGVYKPLKSHFSSEIQRQVVRMDHHCPWINNTIGIGNQKFFILFLGYTWLACLFAIILAIVKVVQCHMDAKRHRGDVDWEAASWCQKASPEASILMVVLMMASALFGLFTTCIGCEQVPNRLKENTQITCKHPIRQGAGEQKIHART